MKNGGKRRTSFSKTNQPPNESKQKKKGKTVLKESIGLDSWDSLQTYLTTRGCRKFISSLQSLSGASYTKAYLAALEYFKPKLNRSELTGKDGKELSLPIAISTATIEQLTNLIAAIPTGTTSDKVIDSPGS